MRLLDHGQRPSFFVTTAIGVYWHLYLLLSLNSHNILKGRADIIYTHHGQCFKRETLSLETQTFHHVPLLQKEALFLSFGALCLRNILKAVVDNKGSHKRLVHIIIWINLKDITSLKGQT